MEIPWEYGNKTQNWEWEWERTGIDCMRIGEWKCKTPSPVISTLKAIDHLLLVSTCVLRI